MAPRWSPPSRDQVRASRLSLDALILLAWLETNHHTCSISRSELQQTSGLFFSFMFTSQPFHHIFQPLIFMSGWFSRHHETPIDTWAGIRPRFTRELEPVTAQAWCITDHRTRRSNGTIIRHQSRIMWVNIFWMFSNLGRYIRVHLCVHCIALLQSPKQSDHFIHMRRAAFGIQRMSPIRSRWRCQRIFKVYIAWK